MIPDPAISRILIEAASALREATGDILNANSKDLARMSPDNPKYDRLKLTSDHVAGIAADMENV